MQFYLKTEKFELKIDCIFAKNCSLQKLCLEIKLSPSGLRKKCPYSESFWSTLFPHFPAFGLNTESYSVSLLIQCEYGKCGKNADQNNSEFGHFLHDAGFHIILVTLAASFCEF